MGTRYQTVRVSGHARGVLDAHGGRTVKISDVPAAGRGTMTGLIVESGKRVWLLVERDEAGVYVIRDVFAHPIEALVHFLGAELKGIALDLLTDAEREQAIEAAQAAEAQGLFGIVGINDWSRRMFGKDLPTLLEERSAAQQQAIEEPEAQTPPWPGSPSKMVH